MAKGVALAGWRAHATLWGALAALVLHASLAVGVSALAHRDEERQRPFSLEVDVNEAPPPPVAPPSLPEPRPESPAPAPRLLVRKPAAKLPPNLPRPNRETPPETPKVESAAPVFGVTPESVVEGESAVAVPVGNTLMTKDRTPSKTPPAPLPPPPEPHAFAPVADHLVCQPAAMDNEVKAEYPAEARRLGIEGRVLLRVAIDRQGNVRWTRVIRPAGHGLDEAAQEALARSKFRPARTCDCRVVDHIIPWTYTFQTER